MKLAGGMEVQSIEYFNILKVMLSGHAAFGARRSLARILSSGLLITANSQKREIIPLLKNRVSLRDSAIVTKER